MNDDRDFDDHEFCEAMLSPQMFDPPYRTEISVAGTPIFLIPYSEKKYRNFLDWWFKEGRLTPDDPQDWATLSGPWVMRGRVEAISAEEWNALPEPEQNLIKSWANRLPLSFLYD